MKKQIASALFVGEKSSRKPSRTVLKVQNIMSHIRREELYKGRTGPRRGSSQHRMVSGGDKDDCKGTPHKVC